MRDIDSRNVTHNLKIKQRSNVNIPQNLPSNGVIANAVHLYIDLYFQGHKMFGNHIIFNIWKTVSASEKCSCTTFIESDTSHRMSS